MRTRAFFRSPLTMTMTSWSYCDSPGTRRDIEINALLNVVPILPWRHKACPRWRRLHLFLDARLASGTSASSQCVPRELASAIDLWRGFYPHRLTRQAYLVCRGTVISCLNWDKRFDQRHEDTCSESTHNSTYGSPLSSKRRNLHS